MSKEETISAIRQLIAETIAIISVSIVPPKEVDDKIDWLARHLYSQGLRFVKKRTPHTIPELKGFGK